MRRTLTLLVVATTTAVVIALVVPLALLVGRLAQNRALSAATQQAQSVALLLAVGQEPAGLQSVLAASDERDGLRTSIVPPSGVAVGPAVPAGDLARARQGQSFTTSDGQSPDSAAVYVPVSVGNATSVVRVGIPRATMTDGVTRARTVLVALATGLVLVSVAAAVLLARRVSAPLVNAAEVAHELRRGRLHRRVTPAGPPEVQEVGTALNQLAGRIGELLQAEREAAADLSHRLRTPVTALRLAVDTTPDAAERERLREHLDRLEGTVDAVVRQSRQPVTAAEGEPVWADLAAVARERAEFWAALAEDQHRRFDVRVDGPAPVPVDAEDLVDVLDVLLDNVFAHTEPGVALAVTVDRQGGSRLVVEDEGPGLPDASALGRGRSGAGSTGLGLSIVARVAAATGAELEVGAGAAGGARISLRWGQGDR